MKRIVLGCIILLSIAASAQPAKSPVSDVARTMLAGREKNTVAAFEAMPADKFGYKPTPEQMTFGHLAAHIVSSNYYFCANAGAVAQPKKDELKGTEDQPALVAAMKASFEFCHTALATADAFAPLIGHRRQALWATLGLAADAPRTAPLTAGTSSRESQIDLLPPSEGQNIVADYERTSLTLRRHPLALLRSRFDAMRLVSAAGIAKARHKQPIRTTGIVTCRQRPSTASGVTFVTLEDETGTINVVVWRTTAEQYRRELVASTLLTVYGHVERSETPSVPVIHVIAQRLVDHSPLLGRLTVPSRDFH